MLKADIIDSKPHCPRCGNRNYHVTDYNEVNTVLGNCTSIQARCVCGIQFHYCLKMNMTEAEYYVFNENDEVEINE